MTLANRITGAWWAQEGEGEKGSNDAFIKKILFKYKLNLKILIIF